MKVLRDTRAAYRLCGAGVLRRVCLLMDVASELYSEARAAEPPKLRLFPSAKEREELAQLGEDVDDFEDALEKLRAKRRARRSNDNEDSLNISEVDTVLACHSFFLFVISSSPLRL